MNVKQVLFCVLGVFPLATVGISPSRAYQVFIGGNIKQEELLDRAQWTFVADNCDGYFNHPDGLRLMPLEKRQQISALFKNKAVILEANHGGAPNPWSNDSSSSNNNPKHLSLKEAGFTPYGAFIAFGNQSIEKWHELAAQYQQRGYQNLFLMTGISMGVRGEGWRDSGNDETRNLLQDPLTAGSGVDEPVNLFLANEKWRDSTVDQIFWVHQHDKKFLYLISPNSAGTDFLQESQKTVRLLEEKGSIPDIYAVEYYRAGYDMTPETVPDGKGGVLPANTVTGIAYWLIKHRDGNPDFADLRVKDSLGRMVGHNIVPPEATTEHPILQLQPGESTLRCTVNITSRDAAIDYAPVLQAKLKGATKAWRVRFAVDGREVSDAVLKDGFVFAGKEVLWPDTTRSMTMTLRREDLATTHGNLNVVLLLRANPSSKIIRDSVVVTASSTLGTVFPLAENLRR